MDPIRVESQFNESTACMQNFSPAARERGVQRIELTQFTMPVHHTERYTGDWTSSECFDGIRNRHGAHGNPRRDIPIAHRLEGENPPY